MNFLKCHCTRGFTLIEVLIGMGVLSVAMLGIAQLGIHDTKTSKSQNLDLDFALMSSNVGMALENSCTHTLLNQTLALNGPVTLNLNTPAANVYTVVSTVATNATGIQATGLSFSKVSGPVTTSPDGTAEFIATVTLQAKKFLTNGVIDPNAPIYRKDFEIDAWLNAANKIKTCQRAADPSGSSVTLFGTTTVCPSATLTGTWAITSGLIKAAFLVEGNNQIPVAITSATGGTFAITLPATHGPYSKTYTLFVNGPLGQTSWANTTAQTFTINVDSSPPCP